ncbi:MAG: DUF3276 family protein [Bacteroidales bacterium]|nr:DUF3276 family protein [Bacteroidales bacterium]
MAESDYNEKDRDREEIFSRTVRAGKRTYFFDVKATKSNEYYLTITESKRRFSNDQGKFFYEKHKLFLYKEDFEKFARGLEEVIGFITSGKMPEPEDNNTFHNHEASSDVEFEDLGKGEMETDADSHSGFADKY